jgi:hypothetical protein
MFSVIKQLLCDLRLPYDAKNYRFIVLFVHQLSEVLLHQILEIKKKKAHGKVSSENRKEAIVFFPLCTKAPSYQHSREKGPGAVLGVIPSHLVFVRTL